MTLESFHTGANDWLSAGTTRTEMSQPWRPKPFKLPRKSVVVGGGTIGAANSDGTPLDPLLPFMDGAGKMPFGRWLNCTCAPPAGCWAICSRLLFQNECGVDTWVDPLR